MRQVFFTLLALLAAVGMGMMTYDAFKNGSIGAGSIATALTLLVVGALVIAGWSRDV